MFMRRNTTAVAVSGKSALGVANRSLSNHIREKGLLSPERGQTAYAKLPTKAITFAPTSLALRKAGGGGSEQKMDVEAELKLKEVSAEALGTNEEIVLSILYYVQFLFRIAKIVDHYSFFETPWRKEKLLFFLVKNIMIKLTKLKEMQERS